MADRKTESEPIADEKTEQTPDQKVAEPSGDNQDGVAEQKKQDEQQTELDAVADALGLGDDDPEEQKEQKEPEKSEEKTVGKSEDDKPREDDSGEIEKTDEQKELEELKAKLNIKDGQGEKQEEEDLYQLPEEVKGKKARDRFHKLANGNKQLSQEVQELKTQISSINEAFAKTKCDSKEIANGLELLRLLKSNDSSELEKAWSMIEKARQSLAISLGKKDSGVDSLQDYPDLKQRVEELELTEDDALEIAQARMKRKLEEQSSSEQQQQLMAEEQYKEQAREAENTINEMERQWLAEDPDYMSKRKIIMDDLREIADQYYPHQWPMVVKQIYTSISAAKQKQDAQQQEEDTPLRSSTAAGGESSPRTELEAVERELGLV